MSLAKTTAMSLTVTVFKMLSALFVNKAIAVFIGPSGLAAIGQFQNFIQLAMTLGQGGINAGVTKYTSEYANEDSKLQSLLSTALIISFSCSVCVGLCLIFLSDYLSSYLLDNAKYSYIFFIFGFTLIFFVFNSILLSILNGLKETVFWFKINIIQSFLSVFLTTLLIYLFALDGAFIALVVNQSVVFFILFLLLRGHPIIKFKSILNGVDKLFVNKLAKFSFAALTSALIVPFSHIFIRDYIITQLGVDEAGYWQGIWYISSMYLMVITSTLSVYYLPKLSEVKDKLLLRYEIRKGLSIFIPIASLMAILVYFCKDLIISILFTEQFLPMGELFMWQMVGDVLKIASWFFGYLMLAKARMKTFMICEIMFSFLFIFLSINFIDNFGLIGITYAYTLNYLLYLIFSFFITKKEFSI